MNKNAKAPAGELEQHPLAVQLVPGTMPDEEFEALCADIKKRGQQHPGIVFEGKVLDGWHRQRACRKLGITFQFKDYEGDDAAGLVIALNVLRRKLGSTQRALAGARLNQDFGVSQDEAAKRVGVSKVHINLVGQALRSNNARVLKMLENPDLTRAALHEELVDCGIIRAASTPFTGAAAAPGKTTVNPAAMGAGLEDFFANRAQASNDEEDEDEDDDLLGGGNADGVEASPELDEALGEPPSANGKVLELKGKGETTPGGMPVVGARPTHPERRNRDTPAFKLAESFKGLSEGDKVSFMQMAWPTMSKLLKVAGLEMPVDAATAAAEAIDKAAKSAAKPTRQKKVA